MRGRTGTQDNGFPKAARKAEIITGSPALRFLCSQSATTQPTQMDERLSYTNIFSKVTTKESTAHSKDYSPPTVSPLLPGRTQRKAYKPSRVPPLEEMKLLRSEEKYDVLHHSVLSATILDPRKENRIDGKSPLCLHDGKGDQRHILSSHQNAPLVCKNLSCKAMLHPDESFCRRCSCCICKEFDDNKDPSLWITCDREEEGCGLSCHAECALKYEVAGVLKKDGSVCLDGSFVCISCAKISPLLGLWRRQLLIAKAARRVDVLCLRLSLGLRLLNGTCRYKAAHNTLENAVKKLEAEVSLMKKDSAKLKRCIVKRLSCDAEVQELIDLALEQAENLGDAQSIVVRTAGHAEMHKRTSSIMQFEDVSSSSLLVVVMNSHALDDTLGYKLWHRKSTDPCYPAAPTYIIPESSKQVLVSDLQPCTSYTFKIAPFYSHSNQEECEAACCTKGINLALEENHANIATADYTFTDAEQMCDGMRSMDNQQPDDWNETEPVDIAHATRVEEFADSQHNINTLLISEVSESKCDLVMDLGGMQQKHPFAIRKLMRDSDVWDATSTGELEKGRGGFFISRDAVENGADISEVDMTNRNGNRGGWTMQLHCSKSQTSKRTLHGGLNGQGFCNSISHVEELTIRLVRWLECQGHLDKDFRKKFLTWYGFRASKQEKRIVSVFIDTLQDSPGSLAAQLVDAFQEMIDSKRQRAAEFGYLNRVS